MKKKWILASGAIAAGGALMFARTKARAGRGLTAVFSDDTFQLTGVAMSKRGRLFVNYPRWSDIYLNAVVEVMADGSTAPFPDERWNGWDRKPETSRDHFVCVQSVVVDDSDALWVLDPAAPMLTSPVPGGAKLVRIDLASNQVARVFLFGADVIRPGSYLNDVRLDLRSNTAYITDSGVGGIVVVDLATGQAHRALDGHASVMAEQGVQIVISGKPVVDAQGRPPMFNSDGIALSADGAFLYYQPITATALYRVRTDVLRDRHATPTAVSAAVERYASTFPVDGIWIDAQDRVYLTDLTHMAISRLLPDRTIERLIVDQRLQWPDTFTQGADGTMYVTTSHINESATFNHGKSVRKRPYHVFAFMPPA
ncbi:MAG: major royal jelly protein [Acidobacteria bacterium]|nr:major royal jelly protein [Acidobacteriota bacterium]